MSSSVSPLSSGTSLKETSTSPKITASHPYTAIQSWIDEYIATSAITINFTTRNSTNSKSTECPVVFIRRRVSITSNKSTSNASLAAFLRNARSSTPSANNIPIINANPFLVRLFHGLLVRLRVMRIPFLSILIVLVTLLDLHRHLVHAQANGIVVPVSDNKLPNQI